MHDTNSFKIIYFPVSYILDIWELFFFLFSGITILTVK